MIIRDYLRVDECGIIMEKEKRFFKYFKYSVAICPVCGELSTYLNDENLQSFIKEINFADKMNAILDREEERKRNRKKTSITKTIINKLTKNKKQ